MSIPLRPYQESAMEAVRQASREGRRRTVVNLPTGTGKTVLGLSLALAAYRRGNRSLWLAHRNELIDQPYRAARALGFPADDIGIVKAERDECSASLVIGCTPTLWNPERLARLNESGKPFSLVVADECFPPGTMVGNVPIEKIRTGDLVPSFDERKKRIVERRVTRKFASKTSVLVKVRVRGRSVVCTPSHPFFTTRGWMRAKDLTRANMVLCFTSSLILTGGNGNEAKRLRPLRNGHREKTTAHEYQDALRGVPREAAHAFRDTVQRMRSDVGFDGTEGECGEKGNGIVLRPEMFARALLPIRFGNDGKNESQVRLGADEKKQSYETHGRAGKGENNVARNGLETADSRRERKTDPSSANAPGVRSGLANGSRDSDRSEKRKGSAVPFQVGHRESDPENLCRSGWEFPQSDNAKSTGSAQGNILAWSRVDSIEILEPGGNGEFERVCPGGIVHNLEVECTHTYIANGFIVHNCHHFASLSNRALLSGLLGDPHVLGLTATLERADRASLAKIFPGGIAYQLPLMRAIADGWLVDFRPAIAIDVPELDLSGVAVSASTGDYVQDDLRAEFQKALTALNAAAVDAWIEHARPSGRTGIFFCLYVEQAMRLRDALRAAGVSTAECVSGETPDDERKAILEGLAEGAVECVTNVGVLTEGYDCPRVNAVVMCRATKSKALYIQCLGRGLRPFPRGAKTDCMVIDLVGNSGAHSPVQAAMLIEDLEEPTQSNRDPQSCSTPGCAGANARTVKRDGEETILCYDCEPPKTPVVALRAKKTWVNWVPVPRYGALAASGPNYSTVIVWPVGENWRAAVWSNRVRTDLTDGPVWEDLAMSLADDAARRMEAKSLMKKSANWRDCAASEKQISALRKWKVMDIPSGTTAGLASDLMTVAVAEASLRGAGALPARKV